MCSSDSLCLRLAGDSGLHCVWAGRGEGMCRSNWGWCIKQTGVWMCVGREYARMSVRAVLKRSTHERFVHIRDARAELGDAEPHRRI